MYNEECVRHTTLYIILLVVFLVKFSNKRYLCFAKIGCGSVIQNESLLAFHFVLHSPCTIFAPLFKAVLFCNGMHPYISPINSFPPMTL